MYVGNLIFVFSMWSLEHHFRKAKILFMLFKSKWLPFINIYCTLWIYSLSTLERTLMRTKCFVRSTQAFYIIYIYIYIYIYSDNREGTLFSWLHVYYAHLASVKFEHSVCRGSLMTIYIYIYIYIYIFIYITMYVLYVFLYIESLHLFFISHTLRL